LTRQRGQRQFSQPATLRDRHFQTAIHFVIVR